MANLIRLKQIESGSALQTSAEVGSSLTASINSIVASALTGSVLTASINIAVSQSINTSLSSSITDIVSASLSGALSIIATDVEVSAVSASIAATNLTISSSISSSNYNLSSSVSTSLNLLSSSLNAFTSSIGLTIKNKLNTENVITSSHQLDGSVINNLTLGTTGDAYSLIVSGALAVVDADITISGSQYNVAGQIWVNGETGSAGNPPSQPYDNSGNPQADIIDQGEW
jgi:hypothetical protein